MEDEYFAQFASVYVLDGNNEKNCNKETRLTSLKSQLSCSKIYVGWCEYEPDMIVVDGD